MKGFIHTIALIVGFLVSAVGLAQDQVSACLIVKVDTNPFFVKMIEGAEKSAAQNNIRLLTYWGREEGDVESHTKAINKCIADGVRGILITPTDSRALAAPVKKAREAGILVIALDTPFEPYSIADATFATNNFKAGRLIGEWAAKKFGKEGRERAKIALLDLTPAEVSVDYLRNNGFLYGFGIDIRDPRDIGDEKDARIVGSEVTSGAIPGGRSAMEALIRKEPKIDLVYAINEPAAIGAHEVLQKYGVEKNVSIVSVDGGCEGVRNVASGAISATSMQFPLLMASKGVEAIRVWVDERVKPGAVSGLHFFDTGVELVTDSPVDGLDSISSREALGLCWGD